MIRSKYTENQYSPFSLAKIYFDADVFERRIPQKFGLRVRDKLLFLIIYALVKQFGKVIIKRSFRSWFYSFGDYKRMYDGKVVFYLTSKNNYRALQDVIDKVREHKDNFFVINQENRYQCCPAVAMIFFSLFYLPKFLNDLKNLPDREQRIVKYYLEFFIFTPGYTWFYHKLLADCNPESFILSNDHGNDKRSLICTCEEFGIKTIYVQHASVSDAFPALRFTFSFLDGIDAFYKYTSNGKLSTGNLVLLGACRYDRLSRYRINRKKYFRNCIGIAINMLDDNKKVDNLCNSLLARFPEKTIKIRSHPAMKNYPFSFTDNNRIIYTCASDETMIEYLDSIDVQISNDSGVHLDTILGGVPTICYNMSRNRFGDNYGYVNVGLLYLAKDFDELITFIDRNGKQLTEKEKVRNYDASYGTFYSGKCSEMIADFIVHGYDLNYFTNKYGFNLKSTGVGNYYTTNNE